MLTAPNCGGELRRLAVLQRVRRVAGRRRARAGVAQGRHGALLRPRRLDGARRVDRSRGAPPRMRRYFEDLRAIIERHGGAVEKFVGDAVMAVFGIPVSHEDDALRAVRAPRRCGRRSPRTGSRPASASTPARSSSAAKARRSSRATPSTSPPGSSRRRPPARCSSARRRGCSSATPCASSRSSRSS